MRKGLAFLLAGYVLSQFYRAFLAVLAPVLVQEIGVRPDDLATSSGLWFLSFAAMQIPVGWALDRIGPRRTAAVLLALGGGGGAAVFAQASGAMHIHIAMLLIGVGCSPVLMASYYIFARMFPPAMFGTLAGATIGAGSLGNIAGATPLALLVEVLGWRGALWGLVAATLAVALAIARFVSDPPPTQPAAAGAGGGAGLLSLLRQPGLWAILVLMAVAYAPAAAIRGLWAGPYLAQVHGADAGLIGRGTLIMALAMVAGSFAYGPVDRLFRSRKWPVFAGNLGLAACLALLWQRPDPGLGPALALLAAIGFLGASYPALMAHGRAFVPAHLIGRGVTLLNLFGIGGAGLLQVLSGRVFRAEVAAGAPPGATFGALFLFFLLPLAAGVALYLFSRDSRG